MDEYKVLVRVDRNFFLDIGLREKAINLLMNYDPFWLRFAVETVFGIVLDIAEERDETKVHSISSDLEACLRNFLEMVRILRN